MLYHFRARPSRPSDALPFEYYSEDEAKVRRDAEVWTERGWYVSVDYTLAQWVKFDWKSSYRFSGGYVAD